MRGSTAEVGCTRRARDSSAATRATLQLGGDGNVFATPATIDQNDWALVAPSTTTIEGCTPATANGVSPSGRALGIAYVNSAPVDAIHAEVAMAYSGQNGLTAHIGAKVTATTIALGPSE